MKFYLLLLICLAIMASCNTLKWRRKYSSKKMMIFQKMYIIGNHFEITLSTNDFVAGSFRKLKKNQIKKNIGVFERSYALHPDSTSTINKKVDSFYSNPNKIKYIIKKNLKTPNIYFKNNINQKISKENQ